MDQGNVYEQLLGGSMDQGVASVYSVRSGPRQSNRRQRQSRKGMPRSYSTMVPTDQSAAIEVMKARVINHKQWDQYCVM